MKIDSSRYNLFWSNPERYRLREIWKLAPIEPKAGTFASLLTYGRRRGTCFHELLDAAYRGVEEFQAVEELKAGGFGEKEITAALRMTAKVRERYPNEIYLAHEQLFEYPIPDSPHSAVGRIDHILKDDEGVYVGDWKTTKKRTKKEMSSKAEDYCRSSQVPFYLLGAASLGFDTKRFLYRLVVDDAEGVEISEHFTARTGLELKAFARGVHQTCELILWMKQTFGTQQPWPQLPERFADDYAPIAGRQMFPDYMPEGYEPKQEHLSLMEEPDAA
jgi:PD-(D/E)XK nuclease superfamily